MFLIKNQYIHIYEYTLSGEVKKGMKDEGFLQGACPHSNSHCQRTLPEEQMEEPFLS